MRIDRFQSVALDAYRQAPEIVSAEPWSDGTRRPHGIELKLATGGTVRHAITRTRVQGEDLEQPEQPVEGEPPAPVEPRPAPAGVRDRQTAEFLAAVLAGAGSKEMLRVYPYDEKSAHPGLGVEFHDGSRVYMLLV